MTPGRGNCISIRGVSLRGCQEQGCALVDVCVLCVCVCVCCVCAHSSPGLTWEWSFWLYVLCDCGPATFRTAAAPFTAPPAALQCPQQPCHLSVVWAIPGGRTPSLMVVIRSSRTTSKAEPWPCACYPPFSLFKPSGPAEQGELCALRHQTRPGHVTYKDLAPLGGVSFHLLGSDFRCVFFEFDEVQCTLICRLCFGRH